MLQGFPMVSQRTTITSDGKPSEDALYLCVSASILSVILWLEGKSQWDDTINPDKLKDEVYGDSYIGGTSAARYVDAIRQMGYTLSMQEKPDPVQTVALARDLLAANKPAIFTELDPYVDTNLPQYSNWTHVCVWIGDDGAGLTAMDPFIAQPVYKSYSTWAQLLREYQLWIVERISMSTVPTGWHDDGTTLTAPNGHKVVRGFRDWVLTHNWDASNVPLEEERGLNPLEGSNPPLGAGTRQMFNETMLEWTAQNGVFVGYGGRELLWREQVYGQLYAEYQKLKAQVQPQQNPQLATDMQTVVAVAQKYIL